MCVYILCTKNRKSCAKPERGRLFVMSRCGAGVSPFRTSVSSRPGYGLWGCENVTIHGRISLVSARSLNFRLIDILLQLPSSLRALVVDAVSTATERYSTPLRVTSPEVANPIHFCVCAECLAPLDLLCNSKQKRRKRKGEWNEGERDEGTGVVVRIQQLCECYCFLRFRSWVGSQRSRCRMNRRGLL